MEIPPFLIPHDEGRGIEPLIYRDQSDSAADPASRSIDQDPADPARKVDLSRPVDITDRESWTPGEQQVRKEDLAAGVLMISLGYSAHRYAKRAATAGEIILKVGLKADPRESGNADE